MRFRDINISWKWYKEKDYMYELKVVLVSWFIIFLKDDMFKLNDDSRYV